MANIHIEYDPTNPAEVEAIKKLFFGELDLRPFLLIQNTVDQILANQSTMQGTINNQMGEFTVIKDQLHQLAELEQEEKQAITDAATRVETSLSLLETKLSDALSDDPDAAALIQAVKTDIANLTNIAAASGVTTVPDLPADPGVPVDNPTSAPVGSEGDINSVNV